MISEAAVITNPILRPLPSFLLSSETAIRQNVRFFHLGWSRNQGIGVQTKE
jgi:hypothetical protein